MRKLIVSMHISLDGYAAGPNGEMDWIGIDDEMFDYVGHLTEHADAALYGRKTFEMMDAYWPDAGTKPNASKHSKVHSEWYNRVTKYVISQTLKGKERNKVKFLSDDVTSQIKSLKELNGKNILIFGSLSAVHTLMKENLVDEYYLLLNSVMLGNGIPFFTALKSKKNLDLVESKTFDSCKVICLHYKSN